MQDKAFVAFVMSHACPLACNFCCSTREVVGSRRISRAMILDCMKAFAGHPAVARFSFTGGEPFLYIDDIKAVVGEAREAGVTQPIHIMTSGYWARDGAQVADMLAELRALGLDVLGLSYDHEHAKWVSPEQMRLVGEEALRLGIKVHLIGTFWEERGRVEELLPDLAAREGVHSYNYPVAEMGRAKSSATWPRRYAIPREEKFSCGKPGVYSLAVYPDGEVYPCCSGGLQIEGKLSCGNVTRDAPERIIYAALTNFHVRMVKEYGWGVLYALVEREAPELLAELPSIDESDGVCVICRDLNLVFADRLAPIYQTIEREYARTRAEFEWRDLQAADGWSGSRSFGERQVSAVELQDLLLADRDARLDYLAGAVQIGGIPA